MKKQAICMTLSCLFVAGAHAQNSVTLYGVIDEGFDYTNNVNGKKDYELQSGYAQGSRWGLRGAEDLGGGVKAIFTLENGFNVNKGRLGQRRHLRNGHAGPSIRFSSRLSRADNGEWKLGRLSVRASVR